MQNRRKWRVRGEVWRWAAALLVFVVLCVALAFAIAVKRVVPILRERVVEALANRFDSRVELQDFYVSVSNGFTVYGGGLRLFAKNTTQAEPLFEVQTFSFHAGWFQLLRRPMRLKRIELSGLRIHVPARNERNPTRESEKSRGQRERRGARIVVDEIRCTDAVLVLATNKPGGEAKRFVIRDLTLESLGTGKPMHFATQLVNPMPIGMIRSSGDFGPFDEDDPRRTPVVGQYSFEHADLGSIKGIGGTLSSAGRYRGVLSHIEVDGTSDTPDFRLDVSEHPVHLKTRFHIVVDGTNGDTYLQPVAGAFLDTSLVAQGSVVSVPGKGHAIHLEVEVDRSRIEDLLELAMKKGPPAMRGPVRLHVTLEIPPGRVRMARKLELNGRFEIAGATFSSAEIQRRVAELSLRTQGEVAEARQEQKGAANVTIRSRLGGHFRMGRGMLVLTDLRYEVPGADVVLDGFYEMDSGVYDFFGELKTKARVSQMVGGWKRWLLKPADRFFAKQGYGAVVPVDITGRRGKPAIGFDFDRRENGIRLREAMQRVGSGPQ
jgi:hypothetical protein